MHLKPYFALCLKQNCAFWTNDERLKKQGLQFVVWTAKLVAYFIKHEFNKEMVNRHVQRKISGLWNEKSIRIKETIMSCLATWRLRGLNTFSMLRQILSS